jgi:glycogen phosphorylase
VEVQALSGRVDSEDRITDVATVALKPTSGPDLEGRWLYEGPLSLDRAGPFGYTVRILPHHGLLTSAQSWAWWRCRRRSWWRRRGC